MRKPWCRKDRDVWVWTDEARLLSSGVSESVAAAILGQFGTVTIHKFYSHLTANTDALHQGLGKLK